MEKRFNLRKITETIRIQFQNARQALGEDLDKWAERLLSLAERRLVSCPRNMSLVRSLTNYVKDVWIVLDGSVAASFRPRTVDEALERMKWQQYSYKAVRYKC